MARERAAKAEERTQRLVVRDLLIDRQDAGVSFEVAAGEVLGLAALEAEVQDRLFEILSGSVQAAGGEIVVDGQPLKARHPYDAIRRGVVLVPSNRLLALLPQRPIRENIAIRCSTGSAAGGRSTPAGAAPGPGRGHAAVDRHPGRRPGAASARTSRS